MKVLITGATGLIGKELGKELVERGHTVVALTRSAVHAKQGLACEAQIVEWSLSRPEFSEEDQKTLQGIDAVVNLMGESLASGRWSDSFKKRLVESRVDSTIALMKALSLFVKPKVWIQGSAIGYYGNSKSNEYFDELSPKGSGFLSDLCEQWEDTLDLLETDIRQVVIRTGVVFSHRGGAFSKLVTPILNDVGGKIGSGEQKMSLIHLTDMARFIALAVENQNASGVYNMVADEPIAQKELNSILCEDLHVKEGPGVPEIAIRIALGEMAEMVLGSQAVKNNRFQKLGFDLRYPDVKAIAKEVTSWHENPVGGKPATFMVFAEQFVPKPVEEVFPFFADAKNLEVLTPDFMNFEITSLPDKPLKQEDEIEYKIKLHGIPMHWVSEISIWDPPTAFVDIQKKGPYSLWQHEHRFFRVKGGTLIVDWARYQMPAGKLGKWAGFALVKAELDKIFSFRRETMSRIFS